MPGAVVPSKFKTSNLDGEQVTMVEIINEELEDGDFVADNFEQSVQSMYYHSAKAHWLVQSIQKDGLWNPIQGYTTHAGNKTQLRVHPGSVRSGVFEEMEDPNMEMLIWDTFNQLEHVKSMTLDETIEYWKVLVNNKENSAHDNMSLCWTNQTIEFQCDMSSIDFRKYVYAHNEKVTRLAKGKPLNLSLIHI